MRITQSMLARVGLDSLNAQRNRLARTQEMAATGLRINRPSDDPVDYRTVLYLKDSLDQSGRFLRSIELSRTRVRTTENALDNAALAVARAKDKGLAARSTTNQSSEARDAFKIEIEGIFDEILSAANARAPGGGYLFSGMSPDVAAFQSTGTFGPGTTPTVVFTGEASVLEVEIDEGVYIDVTRSGVSAFQGANDVFATLGDLWTAIDQENYTALDGIITDLDAARDNLSLERAELGSAEAKADSFENRLQLQEQELAAQISFLEDADAFEVYSNLTKQEAALQASLQVTSRLLTPTLLDYV